MGKLFAQKGGRLRADLCVISPQPIDEAARAVFVGGRRMKPCITNACGLGERTGDLARRAQPGREAGRELDRPASAYQERTPKRRREVT